MATFYESARTMLKANGMAATPEEEDLLSETDAQAGVTFAPVFSAILLQKALANHANALVRSAAATEKYTKSLSRATWVLAAATVILAVATIILAIKGI